MTSLEQMLQEELEKERQHSSYLSKQLKQSQTAFIEELQRISRVYENELTKWSLLPLFDSGDDFVGYGADGSG